MKKIAFALLFVLLISLFAYSQNCRDEDKERAKSIVQKLEADNTLKLAVENSKSFGDCVHKSYMNKMQKFNIRQVAAVLEFEWENGIKTVTLTRISFLTHYYRYDYYIKDKALLNQINESGLRTELVTEVFKKAVDWIPQIVKKNEKVGGTIYTILLDDSALPVLADMSEIRLSEK